LATSTDPAAAARPRDAALTISIATWNNRALVADCLRSIRAHPAGAPTEIFVVDNASTDGTAEAIRSEFPDVLLIQNDRPLGFSTNHNQVLRRAAGRFILLLNDDTVVLENALASAVRFMETHPEAGAVGCALLRPDGQPERISQRLPHPLDPLFPSLRNKTGTRKRPEKWYRLITCTRRRAHRSGSAETGCQPVPLLAEPDLSAATGCQPVPLSAEPDRSAEAIEVERWSGAALMLRRETVAQVGLLDEQFDPAYGEDTDLCYRIRQAGWRIYRLPAARVIHRRGQTARRELADPVRRLQDAKFRWYRKHRSRAQLWLYKAAVILASSAALFAHVPALLLAGRRGDSRARIARSWARIRACFGAIRIP
jgi:hypothetical protein